MSADQETNTRTRFSKADLPALVSEALEALRGRGSLVAVSRQIWEAHEQDLRASGNLFYTWQYDIRWAANRLRRSGIMKGAKSSPTGIWELKPKNKSLATSS
jgi:hypothetical protein